MNSSEPNSFISLRKGFKLVAHSFHLMFAIISSSDSELFLLSMLPSSLSFNELLYWRKIPVLFRIFFADFITGITFFSIVYGIVSDYRLIVCSKTIFQNVAVILNYCFPGLNVNKYWQHSAFLFKVTLQELPI